MKRQKTCMWALLAMMLAAPSNADQVSDQEAQTAVAGWLRMSPNPLQARCSTTLGKVRTGRDGQGRAVYHVICLEPKGYVITAADSEVEPVIAFAAAGVFGESERDPLLALVQRDLPERLRRLGPGTDATAKTLRGAKAKAKWHSLMRSADATTQAGLLEIRDDLRVEPLIESRWSQSLIRVPGNQTACYNYYTPPFEPGHLLNYYGGCTATAWGQIMRYFQYPTLPVGTPCFDIQVDAYATNKCLRGGDGRGGPYRWDLMLLEPEWNATEVAQREAIGALVSDIGIACGMHYTEEWSSASMEVEILTNVFHFSSAARAEGISAAFLWQINPSLDAGLPVQMSIQGEYGHAIVCDGYGYSAGTLYHHLNLGWAGVDDAWYNLPNVDTEHDVFTNVLDFFYNIYTNGSGEIVSGRVVGTNGAPIADANVLAEGGGQTHTARTSTNGVFAFTHLSSNTTFRVTVSKPGYRFGCRKTASGCSTCTTANTGNRWGVDFVGTVDGLALVDPVYGWLWEAGNGWYYNDRFGWMWFEPTWTWAWSTHLQGWLGSVPDSLMAWSPQFRWLRPTHRQPNLAYSTAIGHIHIGQYNSAPISDAWVVSDCFGYVWANGDGTWFYSTTYGWLGVTADGGIWCASQGRFLSPSEYQSCRPD